MFGYEVSDLSQGFFQAAGIICLALYVLAGVIYSAALAPVARFPDEKEYLALSNNLIHGPGYSMDGVHLTACRPPGYAFFLAAIQALGGGFLCVRVIHFFLLGATIALIGQLWTRKLFAGTLIVTGLVICYPVLFYTAGTLYPQTLAAFLFLLALNLTVAAPRNWSVSFAAGVAFGALILEVPTFLLTLILVVAAAVGFKIIRWKDALEIILTALLLVSVWTVRNAEQFDRFVPIASNSGVNLLMGNNPHATPYEAAANAGMEPYYTEVAGLGLNEFDADRFYEQSAEYWINEHPDKALILYGEKVLNFFNVMNVYVSGNRDEISVWKQVVMAISYVCLLLVLGWRLLDRKSIPLLPLEKLLLVTYVLTAFTSAIFFTRIRHRLPFDYLLIAVVSSYFSRRLETAIGTKNIPSLSRSPGSDLSSKKNIAYAACEPPKFEQRKE